MRTQGGFWLVAVALLFLSFSPIASSQTTVPTSFDGYYSAVSCAGPEGCVGAGLYGGKINGVNVGPRNAVGGMICDDYFDNITTGEHWTASGISAGSLNAGNIGTQTLFGAAMGSAAIQDYTEIAYLVTQMFLPSSSSSQQAALSEAIWYITSGAKSSTGPLSATALGFLNAAIAAWNNGKGINLSEFANLHIFTPTSWTGGRPQEMWSEVRVPEGGATLAYVFMAGLACFGAMVLRSRRQMSARGPV
ncbi:MAG: hypothetical protein WBV26_00835 [Candidatus Sulfotelmatobacter sp.]|jgi:hypothetical protein